MSPAREIICIQCPLGCDLSVTGRAGELTIQGCQVDQCKAGQKYAIAEVTEPRRVVTTTVRIQGGAFPLLSVRTADTIPKDRILDCLRHLREVTAEAPVQRGEVVVANILGTGCDIIATRSVPCDP